MCKKIKIPKNLKTILDGRDRWWECVVLANAWFYLCALILIKYNLFFVYKEALFVIGSYVFADLLLKGLADSCRLD